LETGGEGKDGRGERNTYPHSLGVDRKSGRSHGANKAKEILPLL